MDWFFELPKAWCPTREAGDLEKYGRDWTRVLDPRPAAVVFPRCSEEVAEVLAFCTRYGVGVVPSGGRTGLCGGAMATQGELVLSLERLRSLGQVDPLGLTLAVGAGVTTQEVHQHCQPQGLTWPIDLASKGSSQIGGNLATNAGGVRVLHYGPTRHWVTGLDVVLMDGTLLSCGGALYKDNTGLDLRQLMIGSEGILGVITSATLRLTPLPRESQVLLLSIAELDQGLELLANARVGARLDLLAFEYFDESCMRAVQSVRGFSSPFAERAAGYILMEVEGGLEARLEDWFQSQLESGTILDGVVAGTSSDKGRLWAFRENITESLGHLGLMHKNDVAVSVKDLSRFAHQLRSQVASAYPGDVYLFGHVGDGNLHVNVMKPPEMAPEAFWPACRAADVRLYELLQSYGGSVSAEHGIGLLKKSALAYSRGPHEIQAMRQIKQALDPQGLLNPGKVIS